MKQTVRTPEFIQEIFNNTIETVGAITNPFGIIEQEKINSILFGGA